MLQAYAQLILIGGHVLNKTQQNSNIAVGMTPYSSSHAILSGGSMQP